MTSIIYILLFVTLLKSCSADMSTLEKFLTSGFSKDDTSNEEQEKESTTSETSKNDFMKFMKRAGIVGGDNLNLDQQKFLTALESLNPNQAVYYQSQPNQYSPLSNYVAPQRQLSQQEQNLQQEQPLQTIQQLTPQQKQLLKQQLLQQVQQLQRQRKQVQQQMESEQSSSQSNIFYPTANDQIKNEDVPKTQDIESKSASKADRQGFYDNAGYEHQGYAGAYEPANHGFSDHQDAYSAGHYAPPVPVKYVPKPSVNIKIDPAGILKLLLSGIPRPLLNLNGKLFFGVELGKKAGLTTGVGYGAPAYGGGGKGIVLNLG